MDSDHRPTPYEDAALTTVLLRQVDAATGFRQQRHRILCLQHGRRDKMVGQNGIEPLPSDFQSAVHTEYTTDPKQTGRKGRI